MGDYSKERQSIYQTIKAKDKLADLQDENKRLREFVEKWTGHGGDCDYLDEGSPRTDCTCGYENAREQALNKSNN